MKKNTKHKGHILVIDDDDDIRQLLVLLLQQSGYKVTGMSDLDLDEIHDIPDLFILDMLLSGKNGKQICSSIRKDFRFRDIPVIMMSALTDVKPECINAGADNFILKPFEVAELRTIVSQLLSNTRSARQDIRYVDA